MSRDPTWRPRPETRAAMLRIPTMGRVAALLGVSPDALADALASGDPGVVQARLGVDGMARAQEAVGSLLAELGDAAASLQVVVEALDAPMVGADHAQVPTSVRDALREADALRAAVLAFIREIAAIVGDLEDLIDGEADAIAPRLAALDARLAPLEATLAARLADKARLAALFEAALADVSPALQRAASEAVEIARRVGDGAARAYTDLVRAERAGDLDAAREAVAVVVEAATDAPAISVWALRRLFQMSLEHTPDAVARCATDLGAALAAAGELAEAEALLARAAEQASDDDDTRLWARATRTRARIAEHTDHPDDARVHYHHLVARCPAQGPLAAVVADAHHALARLEPERAAQHVEAAWRSVLAGGGAPAVDTAESLARAAAARGEHSQALQVLLVTRARLLDVDPDAAARVAALAGSLGASWGEETFEAALADARSALA